MTLLTEFAPAKLTLYLHVLGKDARGYHLLDSLVAFANIGDELSFKPAEALTLTVLGPYGEGLDNGEDNLIWRAATEMGAAFGRAPNVAITLTKNLPVASGIGGGSADAAACLRALCASWHIDPQDPRVHAIALKLGADVPVCLASRATYMGGVGEVLTPLGADLPEVSIVLANPGIACPTKTVFEFRKGEFSEAGRFSHPNSPEELVDMLEANRNDLTEAAKIVVPQIGNVLLALRKQEAMLARMLGSGATCLGIFNTARSASTAAREIAQAHPQWWVRAGQLYKHS
jgi:4-diphosphocytidyl-2-C-methyl-D-erythritol kinase